MRRQIVAQTLSRRFGFILALVCTQASAHSVGVTLDAGTMGFGADLGTQIIQNTLDVRAGFTRYTYSRSGTYRKDGSVIPYDGSLQLSGIPVLLDWMPFHSAFRLTAGAFDNRTNFGIDATPAPGSTVTINGNVYPAAAVGSFTGKVDYSRKVDPYLGIGWGNLASKRQGFVYSVDLGVIFTGSPQVTLSASNPTNNPALAADVASAQASAQTDVNRATMWPLLQVGVGYAF
ncbi:MAG: hypothetical protein ACYDHM_15870 [Acidiferrobacterales bacterium]